jgi:hypothetical protein
MDGIKINLLLGVHSTPQAESCGGRKIEKAKEKHCVILCFQGNAASPPRLLFLSQALKIMVKTSTAGIYSATRKTNSITRPCPTGATGHLVVDRPTGRGMKLDARAAIDQVCNRSSPSEP